MCFVVVDGNPDRSILREKPAQDLQPITHERKPQRVLDSIIVVRERRARVVRRIDIDALDLSGELLLQRLERKQVVAEDEPVIEDVVFR